ncbi:MAG TPA: high-potential iron-sulfur protein [Rhizobacter sp.]|nr:high-potential iron-sulfur protein [Rhizobacter sp.]
MSQVNRRVFMLHTVVVGCAVVAIGSNAQAAAPNLDESDPQAAALGYKSDTAKADAKKYPNHTAAQKCGTCALFQGKAGDAAGPCPLFAGKQVAANGWCSAWAKKA